MPALDVFHVAVRNALIKDGWTITHDPYTIPFGEQRLHVDLGADMPLAAEKAGRKIAVEVKSFIGVSLLSDLQKALGQYLMYKFAILHDEPERELFLAVPRDVFERTFQSPHVSELMAAHAVRTVSYSPEDEEIVEWSN